tara:strand:- start:107371 stop:108660 length:1290 start_codon:yes stop_codon:yes gene_type:complete
VANLYWSASGAEVLAVSNDDGDRGSSEMTAQNPEAEANIPPVAGWNEFVDALRDLPGKMLAKLPETQRNDPQIRQEVARLALAALGSVTIDSLGGDPDFPAFLPTIGQVLGVGQPNADTIYRAARISPDGIYRLSGTRGSLNQAVIGQVVPRNAETGSGRAHLDINAMKVDDDDSFELVISAERPEGYVGEWWELRPAANRLMVRLVSYDWANEVSPKLALERIDRPMRKPRPAAQALEQNLRTMPQAIGFLGPMFVDHVEQLREEGFVHRFKEFDVSAIGGLAGQFYYETAYELDDGEALIIETAVPKTCPYRSMILTNYIYETTDWYNNHSSLNGHQSPLDSDGKWRVVISAREPGVRNWLDTADYPVGAIQGRWTNCSDHPIPTITKVAFDDLAQHLPADVERISPEERESILRARRQAMMKRPHW